MKPIRLSLFRACLTAVVALALGACGAIDQGNVGVRKNFNNSIEPGVVEGFYGAFTTSVTEYIAKETSIDLNNMTPKAHDNLTLKELDVRLYYTTVGSKVPGLVVKYSGQHLKGDHGYLPAGGLVYAVAVNAISEEVAKIDSLTIHQNRDAISHDVIKNVQASLDATDPGTFKITRVLVQKVLTDPTIEASIQQAVANQKILESKKILVETAKQDALITVANAEGIAKAQGIINQTLTREYLQHEQNTALLAFANKGGTNTVLMPYGSGAAPLINIK